MIDILTGTSRLSKGWTNEQYSWEAFVALLHGKAWENTTPESMAQYAAMTKEQRTAAKDVGGFVGGRSAQDGPRNKGCIVARSLVALDADDLQEPADDMFRGLDGLTYVAYTTHSSTPEHPRWRILIPLSEEVPAERFERVSRELGRRVGEENLDPSTHQAERLMFWPSCCADAAVEWREGVGELADPERLLSCTTDEEWSRTFRDEFRRNRVAQDGRGAGDPRQKPGVIGAFCRAYTVSEAIRTFIPSVYTHNRGLVWTYNGGSSYGGMRIFDAEELWCYSHHATDPAGGRALNAFDLVRIHLFGRDEVEGVPMNRQPAFLKMEALCRADANVAPLIRDNAPAPVSTDSFDDIPDTEESDGSMTVEKVKEFLKGSDGGKPTPANLYYVMSNDPNLAGKFRYNTFAQDIYVMPGLPEPWEADEPEHVLCDVDYNRLSLYLSTVYGMHRNQDRQRDAVNIVAEACRYNPLTDYLDSLEWDGCCRVETLLHDALGAEDNAMNRRITRMHLAAAVARAYEPGIKYDHILTLHGQEGTGKSSLIESLAGDDWYLNRGLDPKDKDTVVGLRGNWLVEVGEMMGYKTSEVELWKSFLTTRVDKVRLPYARRDSTLPRQCIFFATTNEDEFLKGSNGDRRFLPVHCAGVGGMRDAVMERVREERDQIWAEAVQYYRDGEKLYLNSDEIRQMRDILDGVSQTVQDPHIGLIIEAISRAKPWNWYQLTADERHQWWERGYAIDNHGQEIINDFKPRYTCRKELAEIIYGSRADKYAFNDIGSWLKIIEERNGIIHRGHGKQRFGISIGIQAAYTIDWDKIDAVKKQYQDNNIQRYDDDDLF